MRTPPYVWTSPRPKRNLESSTNARRTCAKVNHTVRHRSNEFSDDSTPVQIADSGHHFSTQQPFCGLCCNLKTKTKGSRTSPQCLGAGRFRVRVPNPKESRTTRSLWRKRPQGACYRFGNECHTPDLTSNQRDIWAMDPIIDDVTFTVRNHYETGGAGRRRQGWGWRRDIGLNRRTLFSSSSI